MHSVKTKIKQFIENKEGQCIGFVKAIPEEKGFRIYVAWEWRSMADKDFYALIKSSKLYTTISDHTIKETMNYGNDISGTQEMKRLMKGLI